MVALFEARWRRRSRSLPLLLYNVFLYRRLPKFRYDLFFFPGPPYSFFCIALDRSLFLHFFRAIRNCYLGIYRRRYLNFLIGMRETSRHSLQKILVRNNINIRGTSVLINVRTKARRKLPVKLKSAKLCELCKCMRDLSVICCS